MSMNGVFVGKIVKEVVVRQSQSGNNYVLTSAVYDEYDYETKQKKPVWVSIKMYGKQADRFASVAKPQMSLMFSGLLTPADKDAKFFSPFTMNVSNFEIVSWPKKASEEQNKDIEDPEDLPF